jgi:DNA polymerase I-like protein with 3'-5' exonuclease and polymerase domains
MTYALTLDFETHDPAIARRQGAGWPFKDFEILGMAYKKDNSPAGFTSSPEEMRELVAGAKSLIMHNAQYDTGCLHRIKANYHDKLIVDTLILAKLYDNSMFSYSLDTLGRDFLGVSKDYALLEEFASKLGIKRYMSQMKVLFETGPEIVIQYAKKDVDLTYGLAQWFKTNLYAKGLNLIPFYSDLVKALVLWRSRGVPIDMDQAHKSIDSLNALQSKYLEEFYSYCPDINIESTKQLSTAFRALGLVPGKSAKGGDSVDAAWRKTQDHPAVVALESAKKYQKLRREFVEGVLERAEDGLLYPEINIMGAAETGRFSSSNPNIQQIPKRDEVALDLVASIFIPHKGEDWYSLDFSSQEPRLQVHYAYKAHCRGAEELRQAFCTNVQHDLHQQVADLAGIGRKEAKTINLGISYGMGSAKLATSLKLSQEGAKALIKRYNTLVPYLSELNKAVQGAGNDKGYLTTMLGRRLRMDYEKPYKALNKLIQGGSADQTAMALVQAYREGIPVMFSVHDSIELSSPDVKQAIRMKEIMETVADMSVPCYTEIMQGPNWGKIKPWKS